MINNSLKNENMSAVLTRIFSPSTFKLLARSGAPGSLARLFKEAELLADIESMTVGDLFDKAFRISQRESYRSEQVYKAAIAHKVLLGTHSLKTASLFTEFRVGNSKADVVVINGSSTVYEVKSERDSLERLSTQIDDYFKAFSRVNVICAEKHTSKIFDLVPECVGILTLNGRYQISTVREASDSDFDVDSAVLFDSLSLMESSAVVERLGISIPEVPNTIRYRVLKEIFCGLPNPDLKIETVEVLRETRSVRHLSDFIMGLPRSLRPLAVTTKIPRKDQARLTNSINQSAKSFFYERDVV